MIIRRTEVKKRMNIGESPCMVLTPTIAGARQRKSRNLSFAAISANPIISVLEVLVFVSFTVLLATNGVQRLYCGPVKSIVESFKRVNDMDDQGFYPELDSDVTYYNRQCSSQDISTTDSNDLIVPQNSTSIEAADRMLTHGAVIMKDILSADTAANLRTYLESRHAVRDQLPYMEVFFEEIGRLSLGLGVSDDSSIGRALEEIGSHSVLKSTIEGILGSDPAILEISTLTTLHGARSQELHTDSDFFGSSLLYSRTFLESYTLFIALQDTTSRMGATTVCPGTHMCANEDMQNVCLMNGAFEVSSNGRTGKDSGMLLRGDGLMFNQNVWHRGPGNFDVDFPMNRVNLIITFARRVHHEKGDVRQQAMGTYYYQRWNMWGHTYEDLKHATKTMVQPWAALKALGIYKPRNSNWGLTWTEHFARQMANEMDFYDQIQLASFDKWLRNGFLPTFLFPSRKESLGWEQYIEQILENIVDVMKKIYCYIAVLYLDIVLFAWSWRVKQRVRSSILRIITFHGLLYMLWFIIWHVIMRSDLCQRIGTGSFERIPFVHHTAAELHNTTLPTSADTLIGSRLDAPFLGSNTVLRNHNHRFNSLIQDLAGLPMKVAVACVYDQANKKINGLSPRFLNQNPDSGHWIIINDDQAKDFIRQSLLVEKSSSKSISQSRLRSAYSDCRFGVYKEVTDLNRTSPFFSSGSLKETYAEMNSFEDESNELSAFSWSNRQRENGILDRRSSETYEGTKEQYRKTMMGGTVTEEIEYLFLKDYVLAKYHDTGKVMEAVIIKIHDEFTCDVEFVSTGEIHTVLVASLEKHRHINQGDTIEAEYDDEFWFGAKVISVHPLARYDVRYDDGEIGRNIPREKLRFLSTQR